MGDMLTELHHTQSDRPIYSSKQLEAYFVLIGLPSALLASPMLKEPDLARTRDYGLPFVAALMRYHLVAIPFENLSLHYSSSRYVALDMSELYERMVEQGSGRGGQCMEMNGMFGTVLRSLGFEVMSSAGRVNTACQDAARHPGYKGPSYNGWDHMVNIITLSSERYLIDVGMGSRGPMVPLLLNSGACTTSVSPRKVRLLHGHIPEHTSSHASNMLWKLEVCSRGGSPWIPTYAFSDIEFLPQDFEVMNWYISMNRRSWFTHKLLVSRMVMDNQGKELIGDLTLFGRDFRERIHGETTVDFECKSEQERVQLLQARFGIKLSDRERKGIEWTIAAIQ